MEYEILYVREFKTFYRDYNIVKSLGKVIATSKEQALAMGKKKAKGLTIGLWSLPGDGTCRGKLEIREI